MAVVCSNLIVKEVSKFLSDSAFFALDDNNRFCIRSSSSSTRENSVLIPEVVEVAPDCVLRRVFLGVDVGDCDDCLCLGNNGLSQSDPLGSLASLPVVRGIRRCLLGGSRWGSVTIDTNASVPSEGRLRLLM